MELLKDLTDAEVRTLANTKTPEPMAGVWVLTAPDGQTWTGASPMKCVQAEMHSRIPAQVALARIRQSLMGDAGDGEQKEEGRQHVTYEQLLEKFDPRARGPNVAIKRLP